MYAFISKFVLSALLIAFTSWLAGRKPALAGFILALPLTSLIAIAFVQTEWRDPQKSVEFTKSIFVSVPLSLVFFIPFLFAKQIKISFWELYGLGLVLLVMSYGIHRYIFSGND